MDRRFRFPLIVTLLIATAAASAGARRAPAGGAIVRAPITVPFELVTRHIVVNAKINNSRPLSFVFDTGAKSCVVDIDVARELGLKLEGQLRMGGAGSETLPGSFVREATWTLGGLDGFAQPVDLAIPLARLAGRFGHDFDGIIGSDFIQQFVVEVDYEMRILRLHDKDTFTYAGAGESIPIELNQQGFPYIEGEVTPMAGDPIKGKFVLDLGSGGSLVLMSPVVNEHHLLGAGMKTYRAIGVGGVGGASTGQIGRVRELRIGKFSVSNPLAMFSQDKAGPMAQTLIGNIGQQIASKFRVFLDYSRNRIILEPSGTFSDKMDRAVAGVALTTDGKNHTTIRVTDVLENSPAAEAGVQKDDVIVKVDERSPTELTITKVLEMFEQTQPRKLTIKRGEQTLHLTLIPRRLI